MAFVLNFWIWIHFHFPIVFVSEFGSCVFVWMTCFWLLLFCILDLCGCVVCVLPCVFVLQCFELCDVYVIYIYVFCKSQMLLLFVCWIFSSDFFCCLLLIALSALCIFLLYFLSALRVHQAVTRLMVYRRPSVACRDDSLVLVEQSKKPFFSPAGGGAKHSMLKQICMPAVGSSHGVCRKYVK